MNVILNPFSPGAGTPPPALVGRKDLLEKAYVAVERVRALRSEKSLLLVGLRGVGKTVLLRTIADAAEESKCQVIFIETPEDQSLPELLAPPLREALLRLDRMEGLNVKVKRALRVFRSFLGTIKVGNEYLSMEIDPEEGTGDSGNLQADLSALLVAVAEAANARGTALVLVLDEMQYLGEQEFRALITALHAVGQRQLPLVLFGAGLPQLVGLGGRQSRMRKGCSFFRHWVRWPQRSLQMLSSGR
jgi:Cdc6-like AAA superfamily ATPase